VHEELAIEGCKRWTAAPNAVRSASEKELPISMCEIGSAAFVIRVTLRDSGGIHRAKEIAGLTCETGNFNDRIDASAEG
jgi:hypothetical protein